MSEANSLAPRVLNALNTTGESESEVYFALLRTRAGGSGSRWP